MTNEKKELSAQRCEYLYDKLRKLAYGEKHDNLITALSILLCQIVVDSGNDKKHFLSYFVKILDDIIEDAKEDGRQH